MELIGLVGGVLLLIMGIGLTNRVLSREFLDDRVEVKAIKIVTFLAFWAGMGALFVGKGVFAALSLAVAVVGYWTLVKTEK